MFFLDNDVPVPLFRQLYDQIRERILLGQLAANSRLPSVRHLAMHLSVSRNTVDGAYQELLAEGYIYSKSRRGYFVSPLQQPVAPAALEPRLIRQGPPAEAAPHYRFDFHPARLDPSTFPTRLWRKLVLECLREPPDRLAQYSEPQGSVELRSALRSYLEHSRGVVCEAQQVIITAGLQNSLDIVATLLKGLPPSLAMEDPGYTLAGKIFANHGYQVVPVPVSREGIDIASLASTSCAAVYVTPSHQLPLGHVMPVAKRLQLIEWAEAGHHYILEDDYDSELRYSGRPITSLQGLCPGGKVIYLGTFSKVLSPALRISYMVLPHSLLSAYRQVFEGYFCPVSQLEQRVLAKFIAAGHWERHIRRMRNLYKKKHDVMLATINKHFGEGALVEGQGAGLHLILKLHKPLLSEAELIRKGEQKGVRLFPFSWTCASGQNEESRLMLGFGGLPVNEIDAGVALLSTLCCASEG